MRLRILPEAERDLEIGEDFYESQSPGLGTYFFDCLASDIESLRICSGIHEKYRGLYRALSRRFPFANYYTVTDDLVEIFAVLDCRQNPGMTDQILGSQRKTD